MSAITDETRFQEGSVEKRGQTGGTSRKERED